MRQSGPIPGARIFARPPALSAETQRRERPRPLHPHLLGRSPRHHRSPPSGHRARTRARIRPALQLRRHHGNAQRLRHGPPLLPPPGSLAPGPHHLFLHRRSRPIRDARPALRHRARTVPPLEVDHRLGGEHPRHQRAPVALHRRSPPQWSQAGGDRPRQNAHRGPGRPPPLRQPRQRSSAGARTDPRNHR